jgi:ABC-type nitrate/sulfonate/bicarbonate transport system substrate-binding protein
LLRLHCCPELASPPNRSRKSGSTGRPTIRSRSSSSRTACWRRNSPRTASRSLGAVAGSNKALEFLNAGSIDFGSTAGAAALIGKINGNPIKSIYVYSRPEWTALVTRKDTGITKVEDLKGKRVAVTRGTDPHIFLVRALQEAKLTEKDVKLVLLQHADGRTALERGDVDAWAGLDPLMAQAEVESGAQAVLPQCRTPTPGASSTCASNS